MSRTYCVKDFVGVYLHQIMIHVIHMMISIAVIMRNGTNNNLTTWSLDFSNCRKIHVSIVTCYYFENKSLENSF